MGQYQYPLCPLVDVLDVSSWTLYAPDATKQFEELTGIPFDPFETDTSEAADGCPMTCPYCSTSNLVPWMTVGSNWTVTCQECFKSYSRSNVLGFQFIHELTRWAEGGNDREGYRLRGGVVNRAGEKSKDPHMEVLMRIVKHERSIVITNTDKNGKLLKDYYTDRFGKIHSGLLAPTELGMANSYDIDRIERNVLQIMRDSTPERSRSQERDLEKSVAAVFCYYRKANPVVDMSFDVARATQRTLDLIVAVKKNNWLLAPATAPHTFCARRYCAWLSLVRFSRRSLETTRDIQFAWYSHMLCPDYRNDCVRHVGFIVDNAPEEEPSVNAFSMVPTAELWKNVYGQPMVMSLPGELTPKAECSRARGFLRTVWDNLT